MLAEGVVSVAALAEGDEEGLGRQRFGDGVDFVDDVLGFLRIDDACFGDA